MKLSNAFMLLTDLFVAFRVALIPTLKAVASNPTLLLKPREISRIFMANVWVPFGDGIDGNSKDIKDNLVRRWATGIVLDIGAAYGHLAHYLERPRVMAYVALEPNTRMHDRLREKAHEAGFSEEDGSFLLLACGAEDTKAIQSALTAWVSGPGRSIAAMRPDVSTLQVDTIVSCLTICSIPEPRATLRALVQHVLAPGGQLLFYEHVRNPRSDVAWWQDFWAPIWRVFFDGCVVGLDAVRAVREAAMGADGEGWASMETWGNEGDDPENLFWHQTGRCVKVGGEAY